jgi:protease I
MKKILIVLSENNFRDCEYLVPRAFFEQSGYKVRTVSISYLSIGKFGYKVDNDYTFETDFEELREFDALFFVGGLDSLEFRNNSDIKALTKNFFYSNKLICAVCTAPRLLLEWKFLEGISCTGSDYDGNFDKLCCKFKSINLKKNVVVDRNIITCVGPSALEEFSLETINFLKY